MLNPDRYPIYRALKDRTPNKRLRANYSDMATCFNVAPTTVKRWCEALEKAGHLDIKKISGTHDKLFTITTPEADHA